MTPTTNPVQPGNAASLLALAPNVITVGAPTPAASAAGGFPMSEAREAELLRAVPRLHCAGEIQGFRWWLGETGEKPTGALEAALVRQAEKLK